MLLDLNQIVAWGTKARGGIVMPDTEDIARLKLATKQRIKLIMGEARQRESEYLFRSQMPGSRKAHYLRLADDEIKLAKKLCEALTFRVSNVKDPKHRRKLKKLLGA